MAFNDTFKSWTKLDLFAVYCSVTVSSANPKPIVNKVYMALGLSRLCAGLDGNSFSIYLSIKDGCSDSAEAVVFRNGGWSGFDGGGVGGLTERHILILLALILKA